MQITVHLLVHQFNYYPCVCTVLAQAKKFLPEMAQAEAQLTEELKLRDSTEFDIENVQGVQKYVEMVRHFANREGTSGVQCINNYFQNVKLVKLEESESDTENENGCDSESTQTSSDCDCEGDSDTAERKMKNVAGMSERDSNIKPHRMVELVTEALDEK